MHQGTKHSCFLLMGHLFCYRILSWELIDKFVQQVAMTQPNGTKLEGVLAPKSRCYGIDRSDKITTIFVVTDVLFIVGKIVCKNLLTTLETGVSPDAATPGGSGPKSKEEYEREIEALRQKISVLEAGGATGGPPLPPPDAPVGGGPPPPGPPPPPGGGPPAPVGGGPPPPPPPGGGPPPPGPPPPPGGKGGPPPPPGMMKKPAGPNLKPKPTIKPSQKMKQFDWTKINPNKVENTVWLTLDDEKVKLNAKEFEDLFSAAPPPPKTGMFAFIPRFCITLKMP